MADYVSAYLQLPEEAQMQLSKADIEPIHVDMDLYIDSYHTSAAIWAQQAAQNTNTSHLAPHYMALYERLLHTATRVKRIERMQPSGYTWHMTEIPGLTALSWHTPALPPPRRSNNTNTGDGANSIVKDRR